MRREERLHLIAIVIGLAATPIAVQSAYVARGYYAVGGEWLVLPLSLVISTLIEGLKAKVKEEKHETTQINSKQF